MNLRKIITGIALVGVMVIGAGVVGAQDNMPPQRPGIAAVRALVQIVSDETGLTPREIVAQVQEGSTLADIITGAGGDVDAVIAEAVTAATEQVNEAVANGTITQAHADQILANLEDVITHAVNGELPGRPIQRAVARGIVRQVAQATGLEISEVVEQIRGGATIADVLTANGVDVDTFISDVAAHAEERLDQAVANGRITQERADEMLARLTERLTELMNETHPVGDGV